MKIRSHIVAVFLHLFLAISYTAGEEEEEKEGKTLKLVLDSLEKVKDAEHILKTDITFDKTENGAVQINGQVELSIELGNEYKMTVNILHSPEEDGEYKKVFGFNNMSVCNFMTSIYKKYFYESLKNYSNAPTPDECPVTKDTYVIKDYPLDSSKFAKYLHKGYYTFEASLVHNEMEVLQYIVKGHTTEA